MLMEKLCVLICVVWEPGWDLQVQCVGLKRYAALWWLCQRFCLTWCMAFGEWFMPYEPGLAPERAIRQGPDPVK